MQSVSISYNNYFSYWTIKYKLKKIKGYKEVLFKLSSYGL